MCADKTHPHKKLDSQERSAQIAVWAFPAFILAGGIIAMFFPEPFKPLNAAITPLLGFIMLTMGLTLTVPDFALIIKRPLPILVGVLAQFGIMPAAAWLVGTALGLDPALKFGLLMLGSVPGGTTSNVVAYLAKGDVALSVTVTSCSTLLSPFVTPLLMLLYADTSVPLDGVGMAISLVETVLIPVLAGLVLRTCLDRFIEKLLPALPWLAVLAIGIVVFSTVAINSDTLKTVAWLILVAVIAHNAIGYVLGYLVGKACGYSVAASRSISIEVATQSAALASKMGPQFFGGNPAAALPGAIAAVWHNVAGAIFAFLMRRVDAAQAKKELQKDHLQADQA